MKWPWVSIGVGVPLYSFQVQPKIGDDFECFTVAIIVNNEIVKRMIIKIMFVLGIFLFAVWYKMF